MLIENISIQEVNDGAFKIGFIYSGHALETQPMAKTITNAAIKLAIKERVRAYENFIDVVNYTDIIDKFNGKTMELG